jgi:catechol 2,3-dioxygenase
MGAAATIPPDTTMGAVRLVARDLEGMRAFYERAIGLETLYSSADEACLGVGETTLVELRSGPSAPARAPGTTGLFHLAILVPDRPLLGAALRRVAAADWRLTGASDHLVSEALYLSDPEGNGIEIYRDRPRSEWEKDEGGELRMATLPLDLRGILAEPEPDDRTRMAAGTRMGHVHLNVADIPATEELYARVLGFDVTVRSYPGALFASAGGYHHHLGLNTWMGAGAPAPAPGSLGLDHFEIVVPSARDVDELAGRLDEAGVGTERSNGAVRFADPSANRVLLRPS